ncbi:MAG: nucleoside triphosphate pyrophosphatase [Planctomycetota bacterium]
MRLALASTSPYRKSLLARIVSEFTIVDPGVDESAAELDSLSPHDRARELACRKALAGARRCPGAIVLGSDQVCALGDQVLDKPGSVERAIAQLRRLSGRTHSLITAVALARAGESECFATFAVVSRMRMRALSDSQLAAYVAADQPLDCAGSYRIEGRGIGLFDAVESSDWNAIVGLPLLMTRAALVAAGVDLS